jgi:hypothetical protein
LGGRCDHNEVSEIAGTLGPELSTVAVLPSHAIKRHWCRMAYVLKINGKPHTIDADGDIPLLWVLRDML